MTAMRLVLILLVALSFNAYGDPTRKFGFSVRPHDISREGRNKRCLADPFESGLNVVLVSDKGTCGARIAGPCNYEELHYGTRKGSRLAVGDECWRRGFTIAVVGVGQTAVRLARPREDTSRLPRDVESRARRVLQKSLDWAYQASSCPGSPPALLASPPSVLSVGRVKLLTFTYPGIYPELPPRHDPVLVTGNHAFPLAGTIAHLFFSVNGRLHLAYRDSGVPFPASVPYISIWDLSGGTPTVVYNERARLSRR